MQEPREEEVGGEDVRELRKALLRMNKRGWGVAVGLLLAVGLFLATNWLVFLGGEAVGSHLQLLAVYFPGYRVTFLGSFIGSAYAFALGFVVGYTVSVIYNTMIERAA
ncbi:MAG: hypothetical protein EXR91_13055 [Gemmatimonadetes bacterium]|nr:hypothetical protein [Gemmatimonadota bacterium]